MQQQFTHFQPHALRNGTQLTSFYNFPLDTYKNGMGPTHHVAIHLSNRPTAMQKQLGATYNLARYEMGPT